MLNRRAIVIVAYCICVSRFLTMIGSNTAWAGTRCPAQVSPVALKHKYVTPQAETDGTPDDAAFQYKK